MFYLNQKIIILTLSASNFYYFITTNKKLPIREVFGERQSTALHANFDLQVPFCGTSCSRLPLTL